MITLVQLKAAVYELGLDISHLENAIGELRDLLDELDEVEVKGRSKVDTLLGCMMAAEQIIGDKDNG